MGISRIILKTFRKIYSISHKNSQDFWDVSRVQYHGQAANDYVRDRISLESGGLMISKFGTVELRAVCSCITASKKLDLNDYWDIIRGKKAIDPMETISCLHNNAGFFPPSIDLEYKFAAQVLEDVKCIDILGSYIDQEKYLEKELNHCAKIDIYGYCAPFAWNNPWTSILKGKRVLVVHPFTESIKKQYLKRRELFEDKTVLPEFKELILVKAVQSIAGNGESTGYADWFEALEAMEKEIDSHEYDVALIGCGAYGMSLAAHCKRQGKIAVHMASWVQMLFGIYGQRWAIDQPEYAKFINDSWVRPQTSERPKNLESVENGAYW